MLHAFEYHDEWIDEWTGLHLLVGIGLGYTGVSRMVYTLVGGSWELLEYFILSKKSLVWNVLVTIY